MTPRRARRRRPPAGPALLGMALLACACVPPPGEVAEGGAARDGGQDTRAALDGGAGERPGAADRGPDGAAPDAGGPLANVFRVSPTEDKGKTQVVALRDLKGSGAELTGKWADVYNCMPDPGGEKITVDLAGVKMSGTVCTQRKTARPGADGSYLQITPPADHTAGDDAFTEVMMYHHVTTYHDHLAGDFGLTHLGDGPLRCIVNLQGRVSLLGWLGLPNAAFIPAESGELIKQLGVDLLQGEDAIVFGFNNFAGASTNFSWDASVIYHEYTHFSVGDALYLPASDAYGVNPTPKGLNEGLADYFAASFLDISTLGGYALGSSARDLTRDLRCPEHLVGEEHRDGEVASGALWAARKVLGAQVADQAYWDASVGFTARTTFDEAAVAFLDEIKQVAPQQHGAVKKIFTERGFLGCVRLTDHVDLAAGAAYGPGYPARSSGLTGFDAVVPGYVQYRVALKPSTREVTIEYHPVSGALLGFGGTRGDVSLLLKKGSSPITWTYPAAGARHDADGLLKGEPLGSTGYKLVLSGDCLTGAGLVYQLYNKGSLPGALTMVQVTLSDTKTNTSDNFSGCK